MFYPVVQKIHSLSWKHCICHLSDAGLGINRRTRRKWRRATYLYEP